MSLQKSQRKYIELRTLKNEAEKKLQENNSQENRSKNLILSTRLTLAANELFDACAKKLKQNKSNNLNDFNEAREMAAWNKEVREKLVDLSLKLH